MNLAFFTRENWLCQRTRAAIKYEKNSLIASSEVLFFLLLPRVSALCVAIKSGPPNLNVQALYDKKFCYAAVQNGTLKASNSRRKTNKFLSLYFRSRNCFISNNDWLITFQNKINFAIVIVHTVEMIFLSTFHYCIIEE